MSKALARYETFLVNNVSTISTLESTLRSLTWFLPGRFKDAELASEALASVLNLTSLYHDSLIRRIQAADPKFKPLLPPSPHTRYTRAWSDRDALYRSIAKALEVIRFCELVFEMALRRTVTSTNRWRSVVLLETIKAFLRLVLLKITRRPLLLPPAPERDIDPADLPTASDSSSPSLTPSSVASSPPSTPSHLKNNHVTEEPHPLLSAPPPPLRSNSPIQEFLLPKALTTSSVKLPTTLMKSLSSPKEWTAEIIYTLRPLIYVTLLARDRKSSRPLVISLFLEILSRQLRRVPPASATLERSENARRDRDLFWYLLRGSVWRSYTRPKLDGFIHATAHSPLLGIVSAFMRDWLPLIDEYYYYTAT